MQIERDRLLTEVENLSASSDGQSQKMQDLHSHKLKSLESQVKTRTNLSLFIVWKHIIIIIFYAFQIQDLKKKQENQVQLLRQKQKSDEAAKRLQDEIQFIKAQKVWKDYYHFIIVKSFYISKLYANLNMVIGSTTA